MEHKFKNSNVCDDPQAAYPQAARAILRQLMAYLIFVMLLPKCCTLYAELNQAP